MLEKLQAYVPDIYEAQAWSINNVAKIYWLCESEYIDLKDFVLTPPFHNFFTHWNIPPAIYSKEVGATPIPKEVAGASVVTHFRVLDPEDYNAATMMVDRDGKRSVVGQSDFPRPPKDAKWTYLVTGMIDIPPVPYVGQYIIHVDELGFVTKEGFLSLAYDTSQALIMDAATSYIKTSTMAISFMNCKNVDTVVNPSPKPKSKKKRKKQWWNGKWHRLKINPVVKKRRNRKTGEPEYRLAAHRRIGHFRHYGPKFNRGLLFGKHEGVFWIEEQVVGDPDIGMVEKEYIFDDAT